MPHPGSRARRSFVGLPMKSRVDHSSAHIAHDGSEIQLSVVVPCFNEDEVIREFHRRMTSACQDSKLKSYEIIYVNDGSNDGTLPIMRALQAQDPSVGVVDLARNHGHQVALSAGLAYSRGALVLVIDADLQDPPELLGSMIRKVEDGADVVYAQRKKREGESIFKRATASVFYRLLGRMGSTPIPVDTGDFRLMTRRVVDILIDMPETHRFVRGLVSWIGFEQAAITYDRDVRFAGQTKYPFFKMLAFSLDAITAFATAPLRIVFLVSMLAMGLAAFMMAWTVYSFFYLDVVPGWSSIMTVFLFFTSVQLFSLAFIGEYVGRTFMESKRRPLYLVREFSPPTMRSGSVEASE
jgi:polyisoprenyl-phosphate glycosyltransferase